MKILMLPSPPNPGGYPGGLQAWAEALYQWALVTKGNLENASRVNDTPCGTAISASSYTATTAVNGTMTGTDLANFTCTFVAALTAKGLISPTASRGGST